MKIKAKNLMTKVREDSGKVTRSEVFPASMRSLFCVFVLVVLFFWRSADAAGNKTSAEIRQQNKPSANHSAIASIDSNEPGARTQVGVVLPGQRKQAGPNAFVGSEQKINYLRAKLWQDRIQAPEGRKNEKDKSELKRLIQQVRSVEFRQRKPTEQIIVIKPAEVIAEPNKVVLQANMHQKEKGAEVKLSYEPISEQTLQTIKNLSQHPQQVSSPFQLAEILYLSGRLKEAAAFYQEALNRSTPDGSAKSAEERAWILFQIGSCLRESNQQNAMKAYRQLISEYPDSLWAEFARSFEKLIDWYQKDKPRELVAERGL